MTIPGRLRTAAKRWIAWLGAQAWFRPAGVGFVRSLNRRTFRLLEATPGVRQVYVRGSIARGDFIPLRSDVDLALVLTAEGTRSFDAVSAIHDAIRRARRRNPCIRDWWQHMIAEAELPLVAAFSDLYGSGEWRDVNGRASAPRSDWVDERLRTAAAWSQLCLWSGSAFHAFLYREDRIHDFEAGVKKSLRFAKRLGVGTFGTGPDPGAVTHPSSAYRRARLLDVYHAIERGAERIVQGSEPLAPDEVEQPAFGIIRTERATFLLLEDGLDDHELTATFDDLTRRDLPEAAVTYVLPAAAIAAWPFPAEAVTTGTAPASMPPTLAREVYLFEALFLPSALRLALGFPDAPERLRRVVSSLSRAHRLYGEGGEHDPPNPPAATDVPALFAHGSALCEELQPFLLAFATERKGERHSLRNAAR